MKASSFPRTLRKGLLRGRSFNTLAEYEAALKEARTGVFNGHRVHTSGRARCARCGEWKSRSDFHISRRVKSGLQSYCKSCTREYDKLRQQSTRTKIANAMKPLKHSGTLSVEVTRPDGTVIRVELPRDEAIRLLGV